MSEKSDFGLFVISLDFELFWGIRDKFTFEQYGENVLGVWEALPKMLELFSKYGIHATFATVGAMFSKDFDDLNQFIPQLKPNYLDSNLSPYHTYIEDSKNHDEKYFYGKNLIDLVKKSGNHEIGTHTFSHYYALEPGQTKKEFSEDLDAAIAIARSININLNTFIFPRHQINPDYLNLFRKKGIKIYRETEKAWFHSADRGANETVLKRGFRYLDYFVGFGYQHCQDLKEIKNGDLYAIRASRWLRPYKKSESRFDFLKLRRIKKQMRYAAKNGKIFHLWFHPHDIGIHQDINFRMLEEILKYYQKMHLEFGMISLNMKETVELYQNKYEN